MFYSISLRILLMKPKINMKYKKRGIVKMLRKKIKMSLMACAVMISVGTTSSIMMASAATTYPICTVDGCNKTANHKHSGITYCGHSLNDGHDYHKLCNVSGCTKTSTHYHNGTCYMGHHTNDGHSHCSSRSSRGHHSRCHR